MSDWIAYRQHKLTYSSEGWEVQDLGTSRLVSGKHPFFMLYPHMEEVVRGLSGVFSFYKCTHLIHSLASPWGHKRLGHNLATKHHHDQQSIHKFSTLLTLDRETIETERLYFGGLQNRCRW